MLTPHFVLTAKEKYDIQTMLLNNTGYSGKILLIDLNNEAAYPTLAIGALVSPLKQAGYDVDVFSPLAHGMKPLARDQQENLVDYVVARLLFAASPLFAWANEFLYATYCKIRFRATKRLRRKYRSILKSGQYDVVMVSSYLQYYRITKAIAEETKVQKIPLLLGGPYFNHRKVAEEWLKIDGVTAIFGGEADFIIHELAHGIISGSDVSSIKGIFRQEITAVGQAADPVQIEEGLPIPDFDHFRWHDYPHRVLPIMTGRGCGWGHCLFCSDVTTASTRTFRSRSLSSVLNELQVQSQRYGAKNFIFFDSKLNSNLDIWFGVINGIQRVVPGAAWVASVHVDGKGVNGLDLETLRRAFNAGLRRVSFGLETGSHRLNKLMLKGTTIERTSQFVKDAKSVGISIRTTIILGYPGETPADIRATTSFLRTHIGSLDRVKLSRFKAIPGTAFHERLKQKPEKYPGVVNPIWDYRFARAIYDYRPSKNPEYRLAKAELIKTVYVINKKEITDSAQQFNGLM
ncbi:B12-binding domain-containing radical SAM protein [Alkalimarinus coralli]|uniref:B12-binding domain-containing radical SAM protein n=1 Tax=Alkalimarinus coralli TaxID=2935863 RepID=UPI00202AC8F6|nr:radical SAM protein [Alkalimarinus coralli]